MRLNLKSLCVLACCTIGGILLLSGCTDSSLLAPGESSDGSSTTDGSTGSESSTPGDTPVYSGSPGMISDGASPSSTSSSSDGASSGSGAISSSGSGGGVQAGLLTAGTFDDNLNLDVFRTFVSDLQQQAASGIPSLNLGQRALITVKNEAGNPVGGAVVTVAAANPTAEAAPLLTVPVGTDGRAIFSTGVDAASAGDVTSFTVTVQPPNGGDPTTAIVDLTNLDWTIVVPGNDATTPPPQLDLAFVVDCTGSMGDELEHLKAEMNEIATTVAARFPAVALRYALVCYRDEGDEYVTRAFDFTTSLPDFQTNLSLQHSDGGGDYPEAVHKALDAAGSLNWTSGSTARVLFWIADAPPHAEYAQLAFQKALGLRSAGVRLYPVGASGVADEAEFIMRAAALLTGAEYIFLTDDSGVGNPHARPHIPCYVVQQLKQVFIRLITSELAGLRQYPTQEEILRTVGNPVDGVCTDAPPEDQQQQQ